VHPSGHLWEPEIDRRKVAKHKAAKNCKMEVRYNKECIMQVQSGDDQSTWRLSQTTQKEDHNCAQDVPHQGCKVNLSTPQRSQPVKELDTSGDSYQHGCEHKGDTQIGIHSRGKHMVCPYQIPC